MRNKALTIFLLAITLVNGSLAQNIWDSNTYPDEAGFTLRMAPMIQRIASLNFAHRSLSLSRCPDTGLPVSTWALEGETIFSPYTGRAYKQGQVGYFGALERNQKGEIIRFSGDPLKTELPPATAALLLDNNNSKARAFLSIPGNMRQQYHFACKNWARFYPLLGDVMGEEWKSEFYSWVADYSESRRPSDGNRQFAPMPVPHDLVGEPGHLLGGNKQGGGTENHKTMWRTSGLLYSQLFPDTAYISGYPASEAENLIKEMIRDYLKRLLLTGNGEYDSQVYYPHSIEPFLNLYDFTPDAETKALAKFALDYYFATYGLKTIDGAIAGAQKRGYLPGQNRSEMEIMLWGFFNNTSSQWSSVIAPIHQVTTSYRPNKIIWDIVNKNIPIPYEAKIARPFYHMDNPFAFAETFYCSQSYAMGSIQMTIIDNPNQQMIWSLVAEGTDGPLAFSGGHPMRRSTSGHSPYTQVFQSKGTLILLTAPTRTPATERFIEAEYARRLTHAPGHTRQSMPGIEREIITRQTHASEILKPFRAPASQTAMELNRFWDESREMACSWFFYPASLQPVQKDKNWFFEANNTFVAVIPLAGRSTVVAPAKALVDSLQGPAKSFFSSYHVLAFHGDAAGFVVETGEKSQYDSIDNFARAIRENTKTNLRRLHVEHTTLEGDKMGMQYFPEGLRPIATLNGETQDWEDYTNGAVYISPYVSVKDGIMKISNGHESYTIDFTGELPVYREN
jgi:hypothetical protein